MVEGVSARISQRQRDDERRVLDHDMAAVRLTEARDFLLQQRRVVGNDECATPRRSSPGASSPGGTSMAGSRADDS